MKNKIMPVLLGLTMLFSFTELTFAGTPNVDGGGGTLGVGTAKNKWTPGFDGVRVSVVNAVTGEQIGASIDYTNKEPSLAYHFGKYSKINYRNGKELFPDTNVYTYKNPSPDMPTIISSNGNNNIEAIKLYFCSEYAAYMIANDVGISFENLINGKYKLLLEPIAYFVFEGNAVGMTATEAALYNQAYGGLRSLLPSLTHKNLPLSMFLEFPDLGFPVFDGKKTVRQSDDVIIGSLGLATVTYKDAPTVPDPISLDKEYRTDTQVITAVTLNADFDITPASPATVTFTIGGDVYKMNNVVIPEGESQIVWCKWTTPSVPQKITINISTNKGWLTENKVTANITKPDENPPPDPRANDRNNGFTIPDFPNRAAKTTAKWTVWRAQWNAVWVWVSDWFWNEDSERWVDNGRWVDRGSYVFSQDRYSAILNAVSTVTPDEKVPNTTPVNGSAALVKSGYGINNTVTANVTSSAPVAHYTYAQTAVSYFPEFEYETYNRVLTLTERGFPSKLEFKNNKYSTYNQRVHFLPVWYPDENYNLQTYVQDVWTPVGMLSANLSGNIAVSGSVFDDWHVAPKK